MKYLSTINLLFMFTLQIFLNSNVCILKDYPKISEIFVNINLQTKQQPAGFVQEA